MQALHDVVKAGYVRYIGMSSCLAYQCDSSLDAVFPPGSLTQLSFSPCHAEYILVDIHSTKF